MTTSVDTLVKDIHDRVVAMGDEQKEFREKWTDARVLELVQQHLDSLDANSPAVRRLLGHQDADVRTIGSEFARYGYTQADVELLYDLMNAHRGKSLANGGAHGGPSERLTRAFGDVSKAFYMPEDEVKRIDKRALDELWPRVPKPEIVNELYGGRIGNYRAARKAAHQAFASDGLTINLNDPHYRATTMGTGQAGFGQELVGVQYVGDLWDVSFQESRILPLIRTFEMTAPSAYLPVAVDMPEMMFVAESTSDVVATAQYAAVRTGSNRVNVVAKKYLFHQVWPLEMEEDSIIPFIPFIRLQLARAIGFYMDSLILNGDDTNAGTGNINSDDADPADTKWFLGTDGIRHASLVDNTANGKDVGGVAITMNTLRDLLDNMRDETRFVDFGNPNDPNMVVFISDPTTARRVSLLDEIVAARTYLGNRANFLNGQVDEILGHPLISTMAQSKTDTDGKYTTTSPSTNDTKGQVTAFNREGMVLGWRRRVRLATEAIVGSEQTRLVAGLRVGVGRYTPTGNANAIEWASTAYNIGL